MIQNDKQPSRPGSSQLNAPPKYGQIFLCDDHTNGLESIHGFKGKRILNLSCSSRKMFIFEDSTEEENIVSALHDPSHDLCQFNGKRTAAVEDLIADFEVGEKIVDISCGRSHNIILTQSGRLFSFGFGEFGTLGHGGSIFEQKPRLLRKLEQRVIVSVACGLFHTLALSNIGDVYAWGRGFEGQLGILQSVETSASPLLIPAYFKKNGSKLDKVEKSPIRLIACGAYHSMAIDSNQELYCWGEARYGQTGHGKTIKEPLPTQVSLSKDGHNKKVEMVSGGFGHSLALTTGGEMFSWGLNVKGELGLGEYLRKRGEQKGAIYQPTQIKEDSSGVQLPRFKFIACGHHRSFAVDTNGFAWAWGQGNLGFRDVIDCQMQSRFETSPRKIVESTEERKFDYIVANEDSVLLFAPIRTTSFRPNMTPSRGDTELTLFGTGFIHTDQQTVKFILSNKKEVVLPVCFEGESSTFYCRTPDFEQHITSFPTECSVEVSLDGQSYVAFQDKLFIYPADLATHSIAPKCGSAQGGTDIQLGIEIHPTILNALSHITVGFKQIDTEEKKPAETNTAHPEATQEEEIEQAKRQKSWVCVEGVYTDGIVRCKTPKLPAYKPDHPFYHVDISLNGQQFTGMPSTYRFYELKNLSVGPNQGLPEGGYELTISGDGLFGSNQLKLYLKTEVKHLEESFQLGRLIESLNWDKATKKITFKMPPITWLFGDRSSTPELLANVKLSVIRVMLTLSGQEWLEAGTFKFVDPPPPPPEPEEDKKDSKKDTKKAGKK